MHKIPDACPVGFLGGELKAIKAAKINRFFNQSIKTILEKEAEDKISVVLKAKLTGTSKPIHNMAIKKDIPIVSICNTDTPAADRCVCTLFINSGGVAGSEMPLFLEACRYILVANPTVADRAWLDKAKKAGIEVIEYGAA